MSQQGRHGRGKRPGDEQPPQQPGEPDFSSSNYNTSFSTSTPFPTDTAHGEGFTTIDPALYDRAALAADPGRQGKVAIPPLPNTGELSRRKKKGRISHACDHCRKAKAACTGEQPCARCRGAQVACVYGDGKRDMERKKYMKLRQDVRSLTQQNKEICDALRRIRLDTTLSRDEILHGIDGVLALHKPLDPWADEMDDMRLTSQQVSPSPNPEESSGDDDEDESGDMVSDRPTSYW